MGHAKPFSEDFSSTVLLARELSSEEVDTWTRFQEENVFLQSPYLSYRYVLSVSNVRPFVYVCLIRRQGQVVGFLPFQFRNRLFKAARFAERVGEEMTDYFGLVAPPELRIDNATLMRLAGLKVLYFTHLDESQLQYGLRAEKPEQGLLVDLSGGVAPFFEQLQATKKKMLQDTDRCRRKLVDAFGPLQFCFKQKDWAEHIPNLIEHKGRQYLKKGDDLFSVAWKRSLLDTLAASEDESCQGVLSTLFAGDTWVASHFGLFAHGTLHYWFPVYNADLSKFSPGRLLMQALISNSVENGLRIIDHGAGVSDYKQQFSNSDHRYYRDVWYVPGLVATCGRGAYSICWRFKALKSRFAPQ